VIFAKFNGVTLRIHSARECFDLHSLYSSILFPRQRETEFLNVDARKKLSAMRRARETNKNVGAKCQRHMRPSVRPVVERLRR